jgi:site-specific DNA recombinase
VIETAGVMVRTVTSGELDLSTATGRLMARTMGAYARHEVEHAQERMALKQEQARETGDPSTCGSNRHFGYKRGLIGINRREARELRAAAQAVVVGVDPATIAADWNTRGVRPPSARAWTSRSVCRMLARPRNAAIVEHEGREFGPGSWPAVLDSTTYRGVRAILGDGITPKRRYRPRASLLLSGGGAHCGYPVGDAGEVCGLPIVGAGSNESGRRYKCSSGKHVTRLAEPLEEFVTDVVVRWLATEDAAGMVTAGNDEAAALHARSAAIRARLNELGSAFSAGEIDRDQLREGTVRGKADLTQVEKRLTAMTVTSALSGLAGHADVASRWEALTVDRQRAVIKAAWSITLLPGKRGGKGGSRFSTDTIVMKRRVHGADQ